MKNGPTVVAGLGGWFSRGPGLRMLVGLGDKAGRSGGGGCSRWKTTVGLAAPIVALPAKTPRSTIRPTIDENGRPDWGAYGTVDYERQHGPFAKARSDADRLGDELRRLLLTIDLVRAHLPPAPLYLALTYHPARHPPGRAPHERRPARPPPADAAGAEAPRGNPRAPGQQPPPAAGPARASPRRARRQLNGRAQRGPRAGAGAARHGPVLFPLHEKKARRVRRRVEVKPRHEASRCRSPAREALDARCRTTTGERVKHAGGIALRYSGRRGRRCLQERTPHEARGQTPSPEQSEHDAQRSAPSGSAPVLVAARDWGRPRPRAGLPVPHAPRMRRRRPAASPSGGGVRGSPRAWSRADVREAVYRLKPF